MTPAERIAQRNSEMAKLQFQNGVGSLNALQLVIDPPATATLERQVALYLTHLWGAERRWQPQSNWGVMGSALI